MFESNIFSLPNFVVDDLMRDMSGNAFKLFVFIARKTRASFARNRDSITIGQMKDAMATSRQTVFNAIDELEKLELIEVLRSANGDKSGSRYRLSNKLFGEFVVAADKERQPEQPPCPSDSKTDLSESDSTRLNFRPVQKLDGSTGQNSGRVTGLKNRPVQKLDGSRQYKETSASAHAPARLSEQEFRSSSLRSEDLRNSSLRSEFLEEEENKEKKFELLKKQEQKQVEEQEKLEKKILETFIKVNAAGCQNPKRYANTLRTKLACRDQYTLISYGDFKDSFLAFRDLDREFRGKTIYPNGSPVAYKSLSFLPPSEAPYYYALNVITESGETYSYRYKEVDEIKNALEEWKVAALPYFAVSTDKGGETASDASGDQAPLDPNIAAKLAETIAVINGAAK